jgi:septal ring-binding cell division protein DamX
LKRSISQIFLAVSELWRPKVVLGATDIPAAAIALLVVGIWLIGPLVQTLLPILTNTFSQPFTLVSTPIPAAKTTNSTPANDTQHEDFPKLAARLAASPEWLASAPKNFLSIQLVMIDQAAKSELEHFLHNASQYVPLEQLFLYQVKFGQRRHYRIALGLYPGATQGLAAINALPATLKKYQPFLASTQRMRGQNSG